MPFLSPTPHRRLNELIGLLLLLFGIALGLSLESYNPLDPSFNTAGPPSGPQNLLGNPGSYLADMTLQLFGFGAFLFPVFLLLLSWKWIRSDELEHPIAKWIGAALLISSLCAALAIYPSRYLWKQTIEMGGLAGNLLAAWLLAGLNMTGAVIALVTGGTLSLYLLTSFSLEVFGQWLLKRFAFLSPWRQRWAARRQRRREQKALKAAAKKAEEQKQRLAPVVSSAAPAPAQAAIPVVNRSESAARPGEVVGPMAMEDPPIREIELEPTRPARKPLTAKAASAHYKIPPTTLLEPPRERSPYDEDELKQLAVQVRAKFEEFNVRGAVTQINPGPVVTTFEYKPEAGVKYSRITTLAEDLCLGLQAESILIERIPG
ncbi:MAG: DNA translocase FtsK 4TM domain-containing protein, partial [Acidobacteria bacterium]|nr:DNA translocase FtsK 4TM domain-containing protein [Acidobacteriota bacterium]